MITLLAFVDPTAPTASQWIDVSISIMEKSCILGSKVYALVAAIGILRR